MSFFFSDVEQEMLLAQACAWCCNMRPSLLLLPFAFMLIALYLVLACLHARLLWIDAFIRLFYSNIYSTPPNYTILIGAPERVGLGWLPCGVRVMRLQADILAALILDLVAGRVVAHWVPRLLVLLLLVLVVRVRVRIRVRVRGRAVVVLLLLVLLAMLIVLVIVRRLVVATEAMGRLAHRLGVEAMLL